MGSHASALDLAPGSDADSSCRLAALASAGSGRAPVELPTWYAELTGWTADRWAAWRKRTSAILGAEPTTIRAIRDAQHRAYMELASTRTEEPRVRAFAPTEVEVGDDLEADSGAEERLDASSPLPWRSLVADWPIELRQLWGDRANALQDDGLDWREAERIAFAEIAIDTGGDPV